jgi:hypothetical protein
MTGDQREAALAAYTRRLESIVDESPYVVGAY